MSRSRNRHWIGPRRGQQVTRVISVLDPETGNERLMVGKGVVVAPYVARVTLREEGCYDVSADYELDPLGEGVTWCLDWAGEDADALQAVVKLQSMNDGAPAAAEDRALIGGDVMGHTMHKIAMRVLQSGALKR